MNETPGESLLSFPSPSGHALKRMAFALVQPSIERFARLNTLNLLYSELRNSAGDVQQTVDASLRLLGITPQCSGKDLARIPPDGRLVVIANHPFGGVEGLLLASLLLSARKDVKILANEMLGRIQELRDLFLLVDPFGGKGAVQRNLAAMKQCLGWLRKEGVLGIFPAGEVSSLHLKSRRVQDPEWTHHVGGLIRRTGADVLPVFFCGHNGPLFHMAGLVHPRLRTLMLPGEMLKKQRNSVDVRIGSVIPAEKLRTYTDREMVSFLRLRTYNLKYRTAAGSSSGEKRMRLSPCPGSLSGPDRKSLAEVERIGPEKILVENKEFRVFAAEAGEIPLLLRQIGRCREECFRAVGEGTGKAIDLDRYDNTYTHLILWSKENREVAGGYRIGKTDEILSRHGLKGLYTSSLFRIKPAFFTRIGPALELGRSFVRPGYQRQYAPLLLLWKGIGRLVAANPRYSVLFGPVSISDAYKPVSKRYMMEFVSRNARADRMEGYVKATVPPKLPKRLAGDVLRHFDTVRSVEDLSCLIRDVDPLLGGVPVLLKQYLKIGGAILSFNVDHAFGDVLDGLIMVDLRNVEMRMLDRLMGRGQGVRYIEQQEQYPGRRSALG